MTETFLYLTTTGRTTGLPRQIEIWYVALDGRYYMVSERREDSGWVKNLRQTPSVRFSVGTRSNKGSALAETAATARVVSADREPALAARVHAAMDARYQWSDGLIVELAPEDTRA